MVPAFLGNTRYVLPAGTVCDKCNHYFGTKVEGPLASSPFFANLRSRQLLRTRSGNEILGDGWMTSGQLRAPIKFSYENNAVLLPLEPHSAIDFISAGSGLLWLPHGGLPPHSRLLSRLLAKIGLEALTLRVCHLPNFHEFILDTQLDPIRNWARRGHGPNEWPFKSRRIYDEYAVRSDGSQTVHEFDILCTGRLADDDGYSGEMYCVVCFFGIELTINLGGPDLDGYERWLLENGQRSPLYTRDSDGDPPGRAPAL